MKIDEKFTFYERSPPQGLFGTWRAGKGFGIFSSIKPPQKRPIGGAGFITREKDGPPFLPERKSEISKNQRHSS
jgi:hypothetical protein